MTAERFNEIKVTVESMAAYLHEIELPFAEVEHYKMYEDTHVTLVMECAKITKEEAVEFLDAMVNKAIDEWYTEQAKHPLSFQPRMS